ncbi:MAG: CHAT domain-containing protein [Deltaproteobacteria bacterium]|nr:CHAT domain-containing protein [Deltaproteobacteria bacterium]
MLRCRALLTASLVSSVLLGACSARGCQPLPSGAVEVELAGCAAFVHGPVCRFDDATVLRLSVRAAADAVVVVRPAARELPAIEAGRRRFEVRPPEEARLLSVRVERDIGPAAWTMRLAPFEESHVIAAARKARGERDLDRALALVEEALAAPPPPAARARLLGMRGRVRISRGELPEAQADLRAALALDEAAGLLSDATLDTMALVWLLLGDMRFAEVRQLLGALEPRLSGYAEGQAHLAFYTAMLQRRTGDLRGALRSLETAERITHRLGMAALRRDSRQSTALVLLQLGRFEEAARILAGLADERGGPDADACQRATVLTNLGWAELALVEAGGEAEPLPVLEEALATWRHGCASPEDVGNALVNLALGHLQRGELAQARARLEESVADGAPSTMFLESWRLDLHGRLRLAEGAAAEALVAFDALEHMAVEVGAEDATLRAALGRAEALAALGRGDEAVASWDVAEGLLDEALRAVPLGEGQGSFLASATRGPRAHVDLLVEMGRADDALEVARRSRVRELSMLREVRMLGALDAEARARWEAALARWRGGQSALDAERRRDWAMPADQRAVAARGRASREKALRRLLDDALAELRADADAPQPPEPVAAPGELALVMHPGREGIWVFGATTGEVQAVHLDAVPLSDAEVVTEVLEPFGDALARVERLRVLAWGPLREVDFHALPWRGRPLGERLPIAYAVDMPRPGRASAEGNGALVVVDPAQNLVAARAEIDAIRPLLTGTKGPPRELDAETATLPSVQEQLGSASLFHFAGHGWFGGIGGWESGLGLADGARLTVGHILALDRVPATVVLSGCETGRSDRSGPGATLGIAEAFIIAGADAVIAATRPVEDTLAAALSVALYEHGTAALREDPARALQRAQAEVRRDMPDADWASFRLIVR